MKGLLLSNETRHAKKRRSPDSAVSVVVLHVPGFPGDEKKVFLRGKEGKWDFFDKSGSMTYCETMQRQGSTQEVIPPGK